MQLDKVVDVKLSIPIIRTPATRKANNMIAFIEFLIFVHKKSVLQNGLKFKQKILKLQEIKKELKLPNNLNLDVLKLKVNSCF